MALQGSYSIDNALYSESYAYKCWYNYNYGGNTLGISAGDIGKITQTWNSELTNWQNVAMNDENAYEIEDDDYSKALDDGYKQAQDKTGYDGGKNGMGARSALDTITGATGQIASTVGSKVASKVGTAITGNLVKNTVEKAGKQAATKAIEKASAEAITEAGTKALGEKVAEASAEEIAKKGAESIGEKAATETASKVASKDVSFIVAAPLAAAQGGLYLGKRPNKDQKEACDKLQDEMVNSQSALTTAQSEMESAADEVTTLSDEAAERNESANRTIEDDKSEFDFYQRTYDSLIEKINSGGALSENEKTLLRSLVPIMQKLGLNVEEMQKSTNKDVVDIYDEMGSYQEAYDNSAETIAEVQGVTDFAESFDKATRTNCIVEGVAQGLNAASGATAAYKAGAFAMSGSWAFGATSWAWAFAGMGAAGAAMSTYGTAEQSKWAGEVGTEIDMRENTQDLNAATSDIYDESIDGYEGYMSTVENMELMIPEDMEPPLEVNVSQEGDDSGKTTQSTGFGLGTVTNTENESTKKDEDEKKV